MVDKGEAGLSRDKLGIDESCALAISNIVETACLLHDIGNPPFGHFGESAISNWFHGYWPEVLEKRFAGDASATRLAKDFQEFDGNPQGFRIITRVGGVDDFGMNLTVAQIASTVKYPVDPEGIGLSAVFSKKAGFFHSEGEHGKSVWEKLGLMSGARFPLAYLMEAADDISYCLSDIEDGIEKGYLRHQDFTDALIVGVEKDAEASAFVKKALEEAQRHQDSVDVVVLFRTKIITYLVERIARSYCENHERIFAGQTVELAQNDTPEHSILKAVRDVVADLLYGKRASHELELTGHAAMLGILRRYEGILNLKRDDAELLTRGGRPSKMLEEQAKLFSFLPKKHVDAYCRRAAGASDIDEWMARCHLVTDYISGMTDVFALRTYQMLSGIRV